MKGLRVFLEESNIFERRTSLRSFTERVEVSEGKITSFRVGFNSVAVKLVLAFYHTYGSSSGDNSGDTSVMRHLDHGAYILVSLGCFLS